MDNPFEEFWEQSSLHSRNISDYGRRMSAYDADTKELRVSYPERANSHKKPKTPLSKITAKRASSRAFSNTFLTARDLLSLMSHLSVLTDDLEHRTYPSAGATYSVETFVLRFDDHSVNYYDAEKNGLLPIGQHSYEQTDLERVLSISHSGSASALVIFVGLPDRVIGKYSERGYRFMLLEAGAMMQQLALAIAQDKNLAGCAIGGILDTEFLTLLGLGDRNPKLLTGYLVGMKGA